MCGIAGIYNSSSTPAELAVLGRRLTALLKHRGPDDDGVLTAPVTQGGQVLLVQTRLSIQDLSRAGRQPMRRGPFTIVFNGEIYNFRELRATLKKEGRSFESESDTEVILQAYERWGRECFRRFNGMWALAIFDHRSGSLLLSRDRLGIKPLYYADTPGGFVFGSEPKAILASGLVRPELNEAGLWDYLSYRYVLAGGTLFKGIRALEPGHHLVVAPGARRLEQYWELPVCGARTDPGETEVLANTRELLQSAVAYRLISDVPVGAYLSGGLDSSALAANMAAQVSGRIKTFTIGFEEEGYNEFSYAREVADRLHVDHHEMILAEDTYLDLLPKVIAIKDAPLSVPNEVPLYVLSRELKKHITVVLSGEGADELFGGYGRIFRSAYDYQRMVALANGDWPATSAERATLTANLQRKYTCLTPADPLAHFLRQYTYLDPDDKRALLTHCADRPEDVILNRAVFENVFPREPDVDLHDAFIHVFQKLHLVGLLNRLDTTTMAWGVEARVPFVDHRLIEYVSSLPLKYRLPWRSEADRRQARLLNSDQISETHDVPKALLRQLVRDVLPERVLRRRKVGFPVPLGLWTRGKLGRAVRERLLTPGSLTRQLCRETTIRNMLNAETDGRNPHAFLLWMLLGLEIWRELYHVSI